MRALTVVGITLLAGLCLTPPALGLEKEYIEGVEKAKKDKKKGIQGWDGELKLSGSVNLAQASNVVGQTDGVLFSLGGSLYGALDYVHASHEWRNALDLVETFTRAPGIDAFAKTTDMIEFDSIYLYHLSFLPWFGPFGRFGLKTSLLPGRDVRDGDPAYAILEPDGTLTPKGDGHLTDSLLPLRLKQSVGAFAKPLTQTPLTLEIRVGLGARQVFADDQFVLDPDDDDSDGVIQVKRLESYQQVGLEGSVLLNGKFSDGKISYKLLAEVMAPFANSDTATTDKSGFELTNLEFGAGLSVKIVSWASLDYEFKAIREPQILDTFQIQNNLLLSINYSLFARKDPHAETAKK